MVNSDLNCCICLKIKKYLMNLPHLPTSAYFHQDIIWHIQEVHQWQVRLMHSLIQVWFLNSFQLPNSQCGAYSQQRCKHQYCCACGLYSANIVLIVSNLLIVQSIICCKNQKHFNQFTMSLLFCVILFYIIFLPLFLPLSEFVNTGGTI